MKKLIKKLRILEIELIIKEIIIKLMKKVLNNRTISLNSLNSIMIKFIWRLFSNIIILKYDCFYVKRGEKLYVKNL